jgi:hypothetical protein
VTTPQGIWGATAYVLLSRCNMAPFSPNLSILASSFVFHFIVYGIRVEDICHIICPVSKKASCFISLIWGFSFPSLQPRFM